MNFSNYLSFSLRPFFSKQPEQPTRCYNCGEPLSMSAIEPSKIVYEEMEEISLIPSHDFTFLFFCNACHWWCIRESWSWNEISRDFDFLIVGTESISSSPNNSDETPWLKALADVNVYRNATGIPPNLAKIFPERMR